MAKRIILYAFSLYDIYLYLPDILGLFKINFFAPTADCLMYFDAAILLIGGIVMGITLFKTGGKFNKYLGVMMILMNILLTPWFLWRALP